MRASYQLRKKLLLSTMTTAIAVGSPVVVEASQHQGQEVFKPKLHPTQTLRYGHIGDSVRDLQEVLKQKEYYFQKIDGIYGPLTLSAVRKYQAKSNLEVTGVASPETITSILNSIDQQAHHKNVLQVGDIGTSVTQLQKQLKKLGYYTSSVDGIFGKGTYSAVVHLQRKNKIKVDGIVGEQTWGLLASDSIVANHASKMKVTASAGMDSKVISSAKKLVGTPYVWGGTTPSGFDCSGFLTYIFEKVGIDIPRTVADIWDEGKSVGKLSIGDIVFFETYKKGPSHAGIYIGNNKFIQAGSSNGVKVSDLTYSYWKNRYLGAKRFVQ